MKAMWEGLLKKKKKVSGQFYQLQEAPGFRSENAMFIKFCSGSTYRNLPLRPLSNRYSAKSAPLDAGVQSSNLKTQVYLLTQASIISLAISLSLCSKWWANSCSGQCRSKTNIWRASSFQKRSSDVAEPLLEEKGNMKNIVNFHCSLWRSPTHCFLPFCINCH